MYTLLALLCGAVIALIIPTNGELTAQYGIFPAAAIVHLAGTLAAGVLCGLQRDKKPLWGYRPRWIYLGGAVGVLTTVFNVVAYGKISMTSIVALGLLGQTAAALAVDGLGLFGMEKRPFQKTSLWALAFAAVGISVMLDSSVSGAAAAVAVSIGAGLTVVVSRTLNARLAGRVGALRSSLVNHVVGLGVTAVLAAASVVNGGLPAPGAGALRPWIYCGGMLGVACVLLNNMAVPKVPAFRLTMLTFAAQIFFGILVDVVTGQGLDASFFGGILVAAGVAVSTVLERLREHRARKRQAYFDRIRQVEAAHLRAVLARASSRDP